jgi:hypothetical protein
MGGYINVGRSICVYVCQGMRKRIVENLSIGIIMKQQDFRVGTSQLIS